LAPGVDSLVRIDQVSFKPGPLFFTDATNSIAAEWLSAGHYSHSSHSSHESHTSHTSGW
jgi:hypothetical protein